MKPNDETIYNGMEEKNEENPQVANDGKKKANWKMIGLGGATGILMGAGAIYAADAMAAGTVEDASVDDASTGGSTTGGSGATGGGAAHHSGSAELKVANVEPGQSFSEAFAEARAEVGPGGVFHWRGGIYNTYYKEEWDSMSDEQKHDFAESVRPEYSADKVHVDPHHPQAHVVDTPQPDDPQALNVNIEEVHIHMDGDDDVHIVTPLGSEEIEDVAHVDHYDVDGHHGMVVDFNDEEQHDIAIVDLNDNEALDDGEAMDLHTGDVLDSNLNPMSPIVDDPMDLTADSPDVVDYGTDTFDA